METDIESHSSTPIEVVVRTEELVECICKHLPTVQEVVRARLVCHVWDHALKHPLFWKTLYVKRWNSEQVPPVLAKDIELFCKLSPPNVNVWPVAFRRRFRKEASAARLVARGHERVKKDDIDVRVVFGFCVVGLRFVDCFSTWYCCFGI